ncbi:Homoserine kinase [Glycine max]|uniref:Uncharacterized protein n=2 Tax=Glycine subgen. Soja TaxID=1462606 RepID=A0A0R0L496_SOYBN|nr:hypothetical protein GYH30_005780 [Glycine max]KAH1263974.1 Homoserine kinase [Glycine max]RZC27613.1 hypothetical protein D0Y65_005617 [Glycine soja]
MEPCPFLRLTIDQPCTQNSRGFQNAHCCSSFFFSMLMQTQAQELYLNVKVEPNLDFQEYNRFCYFGRETPTHPQELRWRRRRKHGGCQEGCHSGWWFWLVAVIDNEQTGHLIAQHMIHSFLKDGYLKASANLKQLDRLGSRRILN